MGLIDIVIGAGLALAAEEVVSVPNRLRDAESRGFRLGSISKENELQPTIDRCESDNATLRKELARLNSETKQRIEAKDREIEELRQALTATNLQLARLQERKIGNTQQIG